MHEQFDRQSYADFIAGDPPRLAHYQVVFEQLNVLSLEPKILDIGCGSGDFEQFLAGKTAASVVGYDPAKKLIVQAQSKCLLNATFVHSRTSDFQIDDDFAAAVSILVLPYADTESDLQDIFRVAIHNLKAGGEFISVTFNPEFSCPDKQVLCNRTFIRQNNDHIGVRFLSSQGDLLYQSLGKQWAADRYNEVAAQVGFSNISMFPIYLDWMGKKTDGTQNFCVLQPYAVLSCTK